MSAHASQQSFVSAIDHLCAPVCLNKVPGWLYDVMLGANWSQLCIIYDGHCAISAMSVLDNQGNEFRVEETGAPAVLRQYLAALAAALLDTYIPSWRFGAGSSGTLILDAERRSAAFHNTTKIQAVLQVE